MLSSAMVIFWLAIKALIPLAVVLRVVMVAPCSAIVMSCAPMML
jgi:hypothetical protein